jgi:hypothetical protein
MAPGTATARDARPSFAHLQQRADGRHPQSGSRMAGRMDPFNLVGVARPSADGWVCAATGEKIKGARLSEIGHGNIAPIPAHGGVTVSGISRMATISFAALDRIRFDAAEAAAQYAARAALAAYGLLADRVAFAGCAHETGRATWEVSRPRRYRVHRPEPPAVRVAPPSPYVDNAVCSTPDRPAPGSWRGGTGHRPGRRRPGHLAVPRAVFPSVIPDGEGQVAAGEQPDGADSLDRTLLGRRRSGAASPGACGHRSAEQGRREYCSLVRRILILLRAT